MGRFDDDYMFAAYNKTEHANRLVETARHYQMEGNREEAIRWLKDALESAESAPHRIRDAIKHMEQP